MAFALEQIPTGNLVTLKADGNLTDKEGQAVTADGADADGAVKLPDAAAEEAVGIIQTGGADNSDVVIALVGPVVMATAGGTVTRGKRVMHDTGDYGKLIDAAGGAAGLKATLGIALATAADGEKFPLVLCPSSNYYAS